MYNEIQWILVPFGIFVVLGAIGAIVVPYIRRSAELLSAFNLFLIGCINFVGIAAIQSGLSDQHYGPFDTSDYLKFVSGAVVFFVALFWAYFRWKHPREAAKRRWRKWASTSGVVLVIIVLICTLITWGAFYPLNIPGVDVIIHSWGVDAALFAMALSFITWFRDPYNPTYIAIFVFAMVIAIISAFSYGIGRQPLLTLLMTVPLCIYWLRLRYRSLKSTFTTLAVFGVSGFAILAAYSSVRHVSRGQTLYEQILYRINGVQENFLGQRVFQGGDSPIGGDAVECSLMAIHHYQSWNSIRPFFTIWYIITNPIPRSIWPEKSESLGTTLPAEVGALRYGYINWGPGIVGHGFHEGGYVMLVFYGMVFGWLLRFLDDVLLLQDYNPYVLAMFCSISAQIIAFPRGDFGIFGMLVIGSITLVLAINFFMRLLFGTTVVYPNMHELSNEQFVIADND